MLSFLNSDFNLDHAYRAELRGLQLTRQTGFLACKTVRYRYLPKRQMLQKAGKERLDDKLVKSQPTDMLRLFQNILWLLWPRPHQGSISISRDILCVPGFFLARVVCFFIIDHVIFSWELSFNPSKSYSFIYTWLFEDLKARRCELRNKPPKQTKES